MQTLLFVREPIPWIVAMHRWLMLILSAFMAVSHADGFLFTPKFRYFLNQMRQTQPHNEFITRWDFANRFNGNRITYTHVKGKFCNDKRPGHSDVLISRIFNHDFRDEMSFNEPGKGR